MTLCFLKEMKKQPNGGHIVSISSMSGITASKDMVPYSGTKHAVNGFMSGITEYLRCEKLDKKIKTTCACPFFVKTRKDICDFLNPK